MSHPSEPQFVTYKLSDGSNIQLSITKKPDSSKHAVVCDLRTTLIELTAGSSLSYFTQHRGSKATKKAGCHGNQRGSDGSKYHGACSPLHYLLF